MFDFYEKRKIKQKLYSWPFLIVLAAMSMFLIHGVWGVYEQERTTRINKNQRILYLEELKVREDSLDKEINRLNTDRGIEEEIRQKFEVAKDGERMIIIVDPPLNNDASNTETKKNIFKRFFESIMTRI